MSSPISERSSTRESVVGRPCVLIVDDEASVRHALARYFDRRGWDVCEADGGDSAQRLLEPNAGRSFDLAICDLHMPRFSGFRLYHWLTSDRPDMVARLVFSTGDADEPDTARFLREARRPVLPKPFELGRARADHRPGLRRAAQAA